MKLDELLPILIIIKELALQLAKTIDVVTDSVSIVAPQEEVKKVETRTLEPEKEVTLQEVRTELASLSKLGFTNDVKALLRKYGAEKLSEIKPKDYKLILKDTEVLRNGQ